MKDLWSPSHSISGSICSLMKLLSKELEQCQNQHCKLGEMPDRIHILVTALGVEVVGRRNDSILGIDDPGSSHSRVMLSSPDYEW